jgi:predicted DNA-binding transcriptional regulator AlpA
MDQLSVNRTADEPVEGHPRNRGTVPDPPGPALPPLLLRAAQAAVYCGVSEATWWRWDAARRIPRGHKVSPGVKVWSRLELEQWAALGFPSRKDFEARQATQPNGRPR